MATFVEYEGRNENPLKFLQPCIVPVGYLKQQPADALREMIHLFDIVDFMGIHIPYKGCNDYGLKLSEIADGIGIEGTVGMLSEDRNVLSERFSLSDDMLQCFIICGRKI